jgi:TRAP-type C4-dicarboxylate transport system substrate-binding protein
MSNTRKVKWLIAHQPEELFVRTAKAFSQELNKLIGDELEIEILTYPSYAEKYGEIKDLEKLAYFDEPEYTNHESKGGLWQKGIAAFWNAITKGDIEMSQMQVGQLSQFNHDFAALDLPFLFDDHDHVSRVVDGEIGAELCHQLGEKSEIKGLAFTYSGGYRVIGSNEAICTLDELNGRKVIIEQPLSLGYAIEKIGAETVSLAPNLWRKLDPVGNGQADAVETTYLRFDGKHVLKTNHSVFMTTIIVSKQFWNTLTETQQTAFQTAARAASKIERQWALDDSDRYEREAEARGVTITDISAEDTALLKRASQQTYVRVNDMFSKGLLGRIRKA